MWNEEFIEKDRRIYPFRACKCWACNYPYNRGVVSKLEPLKWFNSAWIGPGICEEVYTWGVVEWVFNHSILEPSNSIEVHVEHWCAAQYSSLISSFSTGLNSLFWWFLFFGNIIWPLIDLMVLTDTVQLIIFAVQHINTKIKLDSWINSSVLITESFIKT